MIPVRATTYFGYLRGVLVVASLSFKFGVALSVCASKNQVRCNMLTKRIFNLALLHNFSGLYYFLR